MVYIDQYFSAFIWMNDLQIKFPLLAVTLHYLSLALIYTSWRSRMTLSQLRHPVSQFTAGLAWHLGKTCASRTTADWPSLYSVFLCYWVKHDMKLHAINARQAQQTKK